ncbi:hypothetical protein CHU92_02215 [Flavobacterium cyanobacteriorum]|uniref:DUF4249 domain-containing protein n=1 Tax=Flavobacterium cyanobacteriorum TaxID=2022802 RepID=A0A255ZUJ8_9FLAO|nr:DUF4249 domain-containing protein [Flavobacterium cyanobacteriorum]OYQ45106.1 hypothetical protein CHU92_02215 [Flavobacterium cyanobacteriorum]
MKKLIYIATIIAGLFAASCEEVVNVDLNTAPPRLVIEASIDWVKGTDGSQQKIKLSTTTGYYNPAIPLVSGATVFITKADNTVFNFVETPGTGEYICNNFVPEVGGTYTLTVVYNGQTYTSTETLNPVPDITNVIQDNEGGFLNEDIEVRFFFQDEPVVENYYLIRFDTNRLPYPDYDVTDDQFFDGNEMFGFFSQEDLTAGDVVGIRLYGISERYYNYMGILISVSGGDGGGGPFATPPATVRGNIINQTNEANYPLGYFRLSEVSTINYTIQ